MDVEVETSGNKRQELPPISDFSRSLLIDAIHELDREREHRFGQSNRYDVVYEGRRYPPKAVVGIAAELLTGESFGPLDFEGGARTKCMAILDAYEIAWEQKRARQYWALQANPQIYDIRGALRDLEYDWWRTANSDIQHGDGIVFWQSQDASGHRGIVGFGVANGRPEARPAESDYIVEPQSNLTDMQTRIRVRYINVPEPLWLGSTTHQSLLQSLTVSRGQGTAFHVTDDQWDQLLIATNVDPSDVTDLDLETPTTASQPAPHPTSETVQGSNWFDLGTPVTWSQVADRFDFREGRFSVGGGMIYVRQHDALLLITHPDGGRTHNYGDRFDPDSGHLLYVGKGLEGDQSMSAENRRLRDNDFSAAYVFKSVAPRTFHFLGLARSIEMPAIEDAPDRHDNMRKVFRFRLSIDTDGSSVDETPWTDPSEVETPHTEGRTRRVWTTRYERNRHARQKCLDHWGCRCVVCNMSFGDRYGDIGQGYIHVHHLNPISESETERTVDGIHDLRPVCPNCHAMLHRRNPPISITECQSIISGSNSPGN